MFKPTERKCSSEFMHTDMFQREDLCRQKEEQESQMMSLRIDASWARSLICGRLTMRKSWRAGAICKRPGRQPRGVDTRVQEDHEVTVTERPMGQDGPDHFLGHCSDVLLKTERESTQIK